MRNGVIGQKLQSLDEILIELGSLGQIKAEQLNDDWRTRRAIERNLQILIEIVVDVCQRIISLEGQSPATTSNDAIERCIQLGVLSEDNIYRQMVRFRNFIVHRYEHIDIDVLVNMVNERLPDFKKFRDEVIAYVQSD
jgi:uncharacterized protein YutE (UPF0331/DUF86 family)